MTRVNGSSAVQSQFFKIDSSNLPIIFIFIAAINWIAYFWHSSGFGLYEDDYFFISVPMGLSPTELWDLILPKLNPGAAQGHFLGWISTFLISFIGDRLGGLQAIYIIAYLIVTINAFLFFLLLRRLLNQPIFTLSGTLAFILFPADTTQIFLTHTFLQLALTLLLIALHFYLAEKKGLAYAAIVMSLYYYGTLFPVFFAAPLLKAKWNSKLVGEIVRHALILVGCLALVVATRKIWGESRVGNLNLLTIAITPIRQMLIGPLVVLGVFVYRPIQTLLTLRGELLVFIPLCFMGFATILSRLKLSVSQDEVHWLKTAFRNKVLPLKSIPTAFQSLLRLAFAGLVMLVLAYPFTFTVVAWSLRGRNTRVHLAAVVGASILVACLCSMLFFIAQAHRKRPLLAAMFATFFALLVGFKLNTQNDYKLSWQYQRAFWTDVVELCPDLADGTVILLDKSGFQIPKLQIEAFSWSLAAVLPQIYKFPENWAFPPQLYAPSFQDEITVNNGKLKIEIPDSPEIDLVSTKTIVLEAKDGKLRRRTEPIEIQRQQFPVKFPSPAIEVFKKGHLYDNLIQLEQKSIINYINPKFS